MLGVCAMSACGTKRYIERAVREVRFYLENGHSLGRVFRLSRRSLKAGVATPPILDGSSQLPPRTFLNKSSPGFEPIFRPAHNTGFEPTYTPSEETVTRMIEGDNGRSEGVGKGGSASATRSTTFVRLCSPQHRTRSRRAASFALSGRGETTGAIRGAAPFRSAFLVGLGQSTPHTLGVEVLGIDWCAWLLPPGLVQPSGIDAVKAQFIDELQDDGLGCLVVARNRQRDAIRPCP